MSAALQAVMDGQGVNQAAVLHGVPPSTLKDRLSGGWFRGLSPDLDHTWTLRRNTIFQSTLLKLPNSAMVKPETSQEDH